MLCPCLKEPSRSSGKAKTARAAPLRISIREVLSRRIRVKQTQPPIATLPSALKETACLEEEHNSAQLVLSGPLIESLLKHLNPFLISHACIFQIDGHSSDKGGKVFYSLELRYRGGTDHAIDIVKEDSDQGCRPFFSSLCFIR